MCVSMWCILGDRGRKGRVGKRQRLGIWVWGQMGRGDLFKSMRTFGQKLCQESCSEEGEKQTKERGFLISEKVASLSFLAESFSPKALSRDHRAWRYCDIKVVTKTYLPFCEKFIDETRSEKMRLYVGHSNQTI